MHTSMFSLSICITGCRRRAVADLLRRSLYLSHVRLAVRASPPALLGSAGSAKENLNVGHSTFLAESSSQAKWKDHAKTPETGGVHTQDAEVDTLADDKGKLTPTSSHLFKFILPLDKLQRTGSRATGLPTVFLLHPSQPLSHISRLIAASLTPEIPSITFRSTAPSGRRLQWSDSTDVGDFIRDAARATEFEIHVNSEHGERSLQVEVPTFADRTRFLRRRLEQVERELRGMEDLKHRCDQEAHQGARRMAVGGLAMLLVYWGAVARLTFWDLGWDIMEPVTYLSGLSMVILGYLWFLYQGREVSYSSVLDRSISSRRQALYRAHGFDIEKWIDLMTEAKALRKEIGKIAQDYDERRWMEENRDREAQKAAEKDVEDVKKAVEETEPTSETRHS